MVYILEICIFPYINKSLFRWNWILTETVVILIIKVCRLNFLFLFLLISVLLCIFKKKNEELCDLAM